MWTHLRTELVIDALEMALAQRRPTDVLHDSDPGTQYTSIGFAQCCCESGVRPSVGDCSDNAHWEESVRRW